MRRAPHTATLNGSFTDPDAGDTHTVVIDWGSGEGTTTLNLAAGVTTFSASHRYPDDNPTGSASDVYAVGATATDAAGDSAAAVMSVTVNNAAPSNTVLNSGSIGENDTFTLAGSFDDPGTQDIRTVVIAWGSGEGSTTLSLPAGVLTFTASHQYLDDNPSGTSSDVYPIAVVVTDDDGGTGTGNASLTVNNAAPANIAPHLSSASINEHDSLALSGSFTDPGTRDTHTVIINWGPGEGTMTLCLPAGVLTFGASHQYLDDNPSGTPSDIYPVSVTVTDDDAGSATAAASLTVNNVAPRLGALTGPSAGVAVSGTLFSGVRGQQMAFAGTFGDVGTLDTHTVSWNFGDGTSTGFGPATVPGALGPVHAYSAEGAYTLSLTVRDDDGGEATVSAVVMVLDVEMQVDPCDDGLRAMVVGGTDIGDMMIIRPDSGGTVEVVLNGMSLGSFMPTGRIIAYGLGGDDTIQVAGSVGQQVWLYGDAGNDRLNAGNGGSLLIGGDGNDQLLGNGGRDVMIGGEGADQIVGNSNDDILVAGYTSMDDRSVPGHGNFWCAVLDEWNSANAFAARVRNLKDGLGGNAHNGAAFLLPKVRDDRSADGRAR